MAKKKPKKDDRGEREAPASPLPKFAGFQALAAGLGDLKSKLDAEAAKQEQARKAEGKAPAPAPQPAARPAPPPARARGPQTPAEAREDDLTFHRMMSGVTPLEKRTNRVGVGAVAPTSQALKPAELRARAEREAKEALEHLHHLVDDGVRFEVTDDGKRVEGRRLDASPNLVRQLRHGALPIDGRLDLHGSTVEEAQKQLSDFLRTMRTRGERCVLVIHGKGEDRPTGGVLRGEMSAWLSQGRAREHVAAFVTAREEDGGEGAVYVALRR